MEQTIPNFFGERGMTSTSANHLANIAKEAIQDKEAELAAVQFFAESVELLNTDKKVLHKGYAQLDRINVLIEDIARMYAFSAWAREAIRRKDDMLKEIEQVDNLQYCKIMDLEMPLVPDVPKPVTDDELLDAMTVKERNEYYTIEAFAATYGKHIHRDGDISRARAELQRVAKQPTSIQGNGRDAIVHTFTPVVDEEQLDRTFFVLQDRYRSHEARLNNIKAHLANKRKELQLQRQNDYEAAFKDYNNKVQEITNARTRYVIETRAMIANLKIVIPDSLRATYDYLNALGKEEKQV